MLWHLYNLEKKARRRAERARADMSERRKRLVFRIAERDENWSCAYCGVGLTFDQATIDHVVPKVKGGAESIDNFVLACKRCNVAKGDMMPLDFMWTRTRST